MQNPFVEDNPASTARPGMLALGTPTVDRGSYHNRLLWKLEVASSVHHQNRFLPVSPFSPLDQNSESGVVRNPYPAARKVATPWICSREFPVIGKDTDQFQVSQIE